MATKKTVDNKAPKSTEAAPAATNQKKTPVGLIVGIVVLVFVVLPMLGFGAFALFVGSKVDDALDDGKASVNIGGEEISVDTNEGQDWPDSMPSLVPEFTKGTIVNSGKVGQMWSIEVENVTKTDVTEYKDAFVAAGWTMSDSAEYNDNVFYSGEKGGYDMGLTYNVDDGKGTLLLTVTVQE